MLTISTYVVLNFIFNTIDIIIVVFGKNRLNVVDLIKDWK